MERKREAEGGGEAKVAWRDIEANSTSVCFLGFKSSLAEDY